MKKGFTLAEVMITLTVIGIITAVVLPVAMHSKPDEAVMKFKKANNTLHQVISMLVNESTYYQNGDLGIAADGRKMNSANSTIKKYFCQSVANLVTAKSVKCSDKYIAQNVGMALLNGVTYSSVTSVPNKTAANASTIANFKTLVDTQCKTYAKNTGEEIVLSDNVVFYNLHPDWNFGSVGVNSKTGARVFSPPNQFPANYGDENGFDVAYKFYCVDIDGIPSSGSASCDDVKDVCPFGYGIRADGKILTGKRADEWLNKSIQGEN